MSVAVDFDGVLCDTVKMWTGIFNSEYSQKYGGLQLSDNMIRQYSISDAYGISHDDVLQIFQRCWERWDLLEPTEPMLSHKTNTIAKLCDKMDIVTANDPKNREHLEKFLQKFGISYDNIIFENDKEKLHHDIFIDDHPTVAEKIFDSGKSALLYNQPWNRQVVTRRREGNGNAFLVRVYSLDHIIHILQE